MLPEINIGLYSPAGCGGGGSSRPSSDIFSSAFMSLFHVFALCKERMGELI